MSAWRGGFLEVLKLPLAGRWETGLVGPEASAGRPVGTVAVVHTGEAAALEEGGNCKRKRSGCRLEI